MSGDGYVDYYFAGTSLSFILFILRVALHELFSYSFLLSTFTLLYRLYFIIAFCVLLYVDCTQYTGFHKLGKYPIDSNNAFKNESINMNLVK